MNKTLKKTSLMLVCILMLCLIPMSSHAETPSDPVYTANKISVRDFNDGDKVLIYHTVYNQTSGKYEDYVIKGDGTLVRVFDKGDLLTGHCNPSPVWEVTVHISSTTGQPSGYYDFYNTSTEMYLSPQSDGTVVSSDRPGVMLNGRRDGKYNSTIERWDNDTWSYYGFNVVPNGTGFGLVSGTGEDSLAFSFGALVTEEATGLVDVATVDSKANGITIHMFDYPDRAAISNITGSDGYALGVLQTQHVQHTLNNAGYPVFNNGNTGYDLFSPSSQYHKGEGNHLFIQSIYDATGYYEYQSFNNFAEYHADEQSFRVYQQIATPNNADNFFYRRGNFMPFNTLDYSRVSDNHNEIDGDGENLDRLDPTLGGTLYLIGSPDYYFGMTVEASFMQPHMGLIDGDPVVYEFNGDDDLWVFIDGVLILDIGGVHDAFSGAVNFATGEITGRNANSARTIKECFKLAGVFPDGTVWDDALADKYFRGNTFADYGSHEFKMFYMEHGASASNLEVRFNLPVVEKGRFAVEKELKGTDQERFANVYFAYQAFFKKDDSHYLPLTRAVYENSDPARSLTFYDDVLIGEREFDSVFYLKPGEAAVFSGYVNEYGEFVDFYEQDEYYVQEIGIREDYFETVEINNVEVTGGTEEDEGIYKTTVDSLEHRARVVYANTCSDKNLNELRITKLIRDDSEDDGSTFEFRVQLEDASGTDPYGSGSLVPYSTGPYYIWKDNEYYRYVNGKLTPNGMTPFAITSGNNGTIAGIPPGYTVIITNLLADTDFHVEEIRLPADWAMASKVVMEGTYAPSSLQGTGWAGDPVTADGQIMLDTTAEVIITNAAPKTEITISGTKLLSGREIAEGEFTFTLTEVDPEGLPIQSGTFRVASSPAVDAGSSTFTFGSFTFDLSDYTDAPFRDRKGNALFYYVVREDIPEGAVDLVLDGVTYDPECFLVVVTLSYDSANVALTASWKAYAYDGEHIPEALLPAKPHGT